MKVQLLNDRVIPYFGYDPGWNLILYDDPHNTVEDAIELLKGLNYTDSEIEEFLYLIASGGYTVIRNDEKDNTLINFMADHIRKNGFQCEVFFEYDDNNNYK